MKLIHTEFAPAAIGPYSQGYVVNGLLYTSGQLGLDPTTGAMAGEDIVSQSEQVMKNLCALLAAAGSDPSRVVKATCFLSDMGNFAAFNEVYGKYFTEKPARSCVAVKALPKDGLVEVEIIAEA